MRTVSNMAMVRGNIWSLVVLVSRTPLNFPTSLSRRKTQAGSSRKRHVSNYLTLR